MMVVWWMCWPLSAVCVSAFDCTTLCFILKGESKGDTFISTPKYRPVWKKGCVNRPLFFHIQIGLTSSTGAFSVGAFTIPVLSCSLSVPQTAGLFNSRQDCRTHTPSQYSNNQTHTQTDISPLLAAWVYLCGEKFLDYGSYAVSIQTEDKPDNTVTLVKW